MASDCRCAECNRIVGTLSWFEANGKVSLLCRPCHDEATWAEQEKLDFEAARDEDFVRLAVEQLIEEDYYFTDPGEQEDDFPAEEEEEYQEREEEEE